MTRRRSPRLHPQINTSEKVAGTILRRSPRLNPQIDTSEKVAGTTLRRSPRLNPQIKTSEVVAGTTLRRSPRLHPQIHPSEGDGIGKARRIRRCRRGESPAAPVSLPSNEDMLWEILLRLPPQPSSLLRASAVCSQWRGLVTDARFLRCFRAHQGKPPLIGVFVPHYHGVKFRSVLDPPDRIPQKRFDLRRQTGSGTRHLLGCRDGRVLLLDVAVRKVIVCGPLTGEHHRLAVPPVFKGFHIFGAVLCAAVDQGHVHGSCHSSPFKVILMSLRRDGESESESDESESESESDDESESESDDDEDHTSPIACVYSSETGEWGNFISTTDRCQFAGSNPGILIGNALYWSSKRVSPMTNALDIVEFDLDRQSLGVIKGPPCLDRFHRCQIIRTEDNVVGLAILSNGRFEVWQRRINCHGGTTWLLQNTFQVHTALGLPPQTERQMRMMEILGYDEDHGAIFVYVDATVYMIQLMSMQFRKLYESCQYPSNCHPFTSFYAPDVVIPGGCDGVEIKQET